MTAALFFGNAFLSAVLLGVSVLAVDARDRFARALAGAGVLLGVAVFLFRDSLVGWRGTHAVPADLAIAGVAIACAWGLVMSLDLKGDRWWAGALVGVASSGVLVFSTAVWTVPALLFLGCASAAWGLATARGSRAAWISIGLSDAALVAVLVADALDRDGWETPTKAGLSLSIALLVSAALRAGVVPRLGALGTVATPAAVMGPLLLATSLISVARWVQRPLAYAAAGVLVVALGISAWAVLRRTLRPAIVGVWPVSLAGALILASERATVPAAVSGVLGMTLVCLWPHALERGRLSRGLVLSGVVPSVAFGALAIAARESFANATAGGEPVEVAGWVIFSAMLPVAFAMGVALGVFAARTATEGDYHPEAVFMTWVLLGASIVTGVVLGTSAVFGALGGGPAAILFALAVATGTFAAIRNEHRAAPADPSALVLVDGPLPLGRWVTFAALALHVAVAGAVMWIAFLGLQVGFL
jgi:hypothetical protein